MATTTTLSTEGQLLIPASMREALNLEAGDEVELTVQDRRIVIQPLQHSKSKLKIGHGGRRVLEAPPDAPEMTPKLVKELLHDD